MKLKAIVVISALAGVVVLAGCETMSAEECAVADWGALGYEDANSNGASRFADRSESCAEKGFASDAEAYRRGFADGMYEFCRPERGFQFARRGGAFNGSCPAELEYDFAQAYADGQRVRALQSDIDRARSEVSNAESRRRQIDEDLRDRETALRAAATDAERNQLREAINLLHRQRRENNDDLRLAQEQVQRLERLMGSLRYEIGGRWGPW